MSDPRILIHTQYAGVGTLSGRSLYAECSKYPSLVGILIIELGMLNIRVLHTAVRGTDDVLVLCRKVETGRDLSTRNS